MGLFGASTQEKTPERPYLRLCKVCHGKGQTSFLNQFQQKTYAPCKGCSNQNGPYALGVSLKCRCQKPSVTYSFVFGSDVGQFKRWDQEPELKALHDFQRELGANGNALMMLCDKCNAQYLAQDGAGERRRISTTEELNESDKEYNRHIANTLIANGIWKEVDQNSGQVFDLKKIRSDRAKQSEALPVSQPMTSNPISEPDRATPDKGVVIAAEFAAKEAVKMSKAAIAPSDGFALVPTPPPMRPSPFSDARLKVAMQRAPGDEDITPAPPSMRRTASATPRAQAAAAAMAALGSTPSQGALPSRAASLALQEGQLSLGSPLASAIMQANMRTNSLFSLTEDEMANLQKVTVESESFVIPFASPVEPARPTSAATREVLRPQQAAHAPLTPVDVD